MVHNPSCASLDVHLTGFCCCCNFTNSINKCFNLFWFLIFTSLLKAKKLPTYRGTLTYLTGTKLFYLTFRTHHVAARRATIRRARLLFLTFITRVEPKRAECSRTAPSACVLVYGWTSVSVDYSRVVVLFNDVVLSIMFISGKLVVASQTTFESRLAANRSSQCIVMFINIISVSRTYLKISC